jgi:hypothetical protein
MVTLCRTTANGKCKNDHINSNVPDIWPFVTPGLCKSPKGGKSESFFASMRKTLINSGSEE